MKKESPWFKFKVNDWITGDIQDQSAALQGVFINLCAHYWSKQCEVTFAQTVKKFRKNQIERLINSDIIKKDGENICIDFLDEQWSERYHTSARNKLNGKEGAAARWSKENMATAISENGEKMAVAISSNGQLEENKKENKKERENEIAAASAQKMIFRVGVADITVPFTEYVIANHGTFIEARKIQNGVKIVDLALRELEQKSIGCSYREEQHVRNTIDQMIRKVKDSGSQESKGNFKLSDIK